jgi:ABC-2 type transport system permease protein
MMNIMVQIIDKKLLKKITKLELHELFIGNIVLYIYFLNSCSICLQKKKYLNKFNVSYD